MVTFVCGLKTQIWTPGARSMCRRTAAAWLQWTKTLSNCFLDEKLDVVPYAPGGHGRPGISTVLVELSRVPCSLVCLAANRVGVHQVQHFGSDALMSAGTGYEQMDEYSQMCFDSPPDDVVVDQSDQCGVLRDILEVTSCRHEVIVGGAGHVVCQAPPSQPEIHESRYRRQIGFLGNAIFNTVHVGLRLYVFRVAHIEPV